MAVKLMSVNGVSNCRQVKYVADSYDDIYDIPKEDKIMGTEIYIIETGSSFVVSSDEENEDDAPK